VIATAACPRCVWERTADGRDAPTAVALALRAHYEVWHPTLDAPALAIAPILSNPNPRPRPRVRRRVVAPAAGTAAVV